MPTDIILGRVLRRSVRSIARQLLLGLPSRLPAMTGELAVSDVAPMADELDSASILTATEVPFREGAARAGLQVALEAQRLLLGRELEDDHQGPRAVLGGMSAGTVVVPLQPIADVARCPDVVALGFDVASKDVDEALADPTHASAGCKAGADSWKRAGAGDS
jgi:hypothetical protein